MDYLRRIIPVGTGFLCPYDDYLNIASGGFAMLLLFIIAIVYTVAALGCTAVIYRNLTAEAQPEATETAAEV